MVSALEELIFYQGDRWEHMMTSQGDMDPRCWSCATEELLILSGVAGFFPHISQPAPPKQDAEALGQQGGPGREEAFPVPYFHLLNKEGF